MTIADYEKVYALWMSCKIWDSMILTIQKKELLDFWEKQGFILREDVNYRNIGLRELVRIDT